MKKRWLRRENNGPFSASDLLIVDGAVYHLNLKPEELTNNILVVGDPDRVPLIADEYFDTKEVDRFHRGLRTITGTVKGSDLRVSVITSGMGTPSLEIVLNEVVALNEVDFQTRKRKAEYDTINIIRVGTSGGLQPDTELGTLIITDYAVGLDNTGLFYDTPHFDERCQILEDRVRKAIDSVISPSSRFRGSIFPYASRAAPDISKALEIAAKELDVKHKRGVTISNSGFFANQGRDISRFPLTVPDIDGVLAALDTGINGLKIENMEMEASFLLHFMGALGYRAGAICPAIANRRMDTFTVQYAQNVRDAAEVALKALYKCA